MLGSMMNPSRPLCKYTREEGEEVINGVEIGWKTLLHNSIVVIIIQITTIKQIVMQTIAIKRLFIESALLRDIFGMQSFSKGPNGAPNALWDGEGGGGEDGRGVTL